MWPYVGTLGNPESVTPEFDKGTNRPRPKWIERASSHCTATDAVIGLLSHICRRVVRCVYRSREESGHPLSVDDGL